MDQCLIFCRTNFDCDNLEAFLNACGGGGVFRGKREEADRNTRTRARCSAGRVRWTNGDETSARSKRATFGFSSARTSPRAASTFGVYRTSSTRRFRKNRRITCTASGASVERTSWASPSPSSPPPRRRCGTVRRRDTNPGSNPRGRIAPRTRRGSTRRSCSAGWRNGWAPGGAPRRGFSLPAELAAKLRGGGGDGGAGVYGRARGGQDVRGDGRAPRRVRAGGASTRRARGGVAGVLLEPQAQIRRRRRVIDCSNVQVSWTLVASESARSVSRASRRLAIRPGQRPSIAHLPFPPPIRARDAHPSLRRFVSSRLIASVVGSLGGEDTRGAHSRSDAHGHHARLLPRSSHLVHERRDAPGAGGAERVSQRRWRLR